MHSEHPAYDAYQRGMELLSSRDAHQAAVALEEAKRLEPEQASIREALGRARLQTGAYADAVEEFSKVLELSPTDHYAHYCLGRALDRLGKSADAARHYRLARCFGSTLVT